MPENFEHPKLPTHNEQIPTVREQLSSELLDLQTSLKRGIARALSPQNDEDRRSYYQELKKLQELPDDQRNMVIEDEELRTLGQQFLFTSLRQIVEKKEYHDLGWKLRSSTDLLKALQIPKSFLKSEENIPLIKEIITNTLKYQHGHHSLITLAETLEIPPEVLDDPEIQKSLPKYLKIQYPKDLQIESVVKYLTNYFPGERKAGILAEGIKGFCSHYNGQDYVREGEMSELAKIVRLVESVDGFNRDALLRAVREGVVENLEKYDYYHAKATGEIAKALNLEQELKNDPEIRTSANKRAVRVLNKLDYRTLEDILEIDNFFQLDKEFIASPEFQEAISRSFTQYLLREYSPDDDRDIPKWQEVFQRFGFSADQVQQITLNAVKGLCQQITGAKEKHGPRDGYERILLLAKSDFIKDKEHLLDDSIQEAVVSLVQSGTKKEGTDEWSRRQENSLSKLLADFPLKPEVVQGVDSIKAAELHFWSLNQNSGDHDIETAKVLAEKFGLSPDFIKQAVIEGISSKFDYNFKNSQKRKDSFGLSDEDYLKAIAEGMRKEVLDKYYEDSRDYSLLRRYEEVSTAVGPDTFRQAIAEAFYNSLSSADSVEASIRLRKILSKLGTESEVLSSPQAQEAYKSAIIGYLSSARLNDAYRLVDDKGGFSVGSEVIQDSEVLDKAHQALVDLIKQNKFYDTDKLIQAFSLEPRTIEDSEAQGIIRNKVIQLLNFSDYQGLNFKELNNLFEKYPLPPEAFEEQTILEQGKSSLTKLFAKPETEFAEVVALAEKLNIAQETVQEAAQSALDKLFSGYYLSQSSAQIFTNRLNDIGNNYPESLPRIQELLVQKCVSLLTSANDIPLFLELREGVEGFDSIQQEIDSAASANLGNNLSTYIRYLGDEKLSEILPSTISHAREQIFAKLSQDENLADYFLENLAGYQEQPWVAENVLKAIGHYSVAVKFVSAIENEQLDWAEQPWVASVLTKAKEVVEQHQKQFGQDEDWQGDESEYSHGNEGFSESDPFENHPWRFSGRQIHIASAISELMTGKANFQELEKLGINSNEISPLLTEANEKINTAYQNFLAQIQSNPNIKDDDRQALLNPEADSIRMTPLLDNLRVFIARYFIQSVEGDVTRLSEIGKLSNELDRIIAEGFRRYIKVHEVDVPLYDKLYEEFDNLRETGRYPLEVYLGRDGIYAWIGRRAQDVSRRRKLGLQGRKKLKEAGEVLEIHPQYTVYPRYFRDNINYETKRQFLEQEGISPDADPLFYDTGYTGTIPEQIMKVMDFEQEDIEKRIRLLSAPSVHRRVKGISENARSEIIEYIEHNAKLEETAEGLIVDEKTGKIRHIARPTNPEEQFYFMMVKQAVTRHYWLQEKLHHEPSGNVNLDSEHFAIRIRQDYAKLLPQEFLSDPKEFLSKQGELLKGSKGEGEYPDEEVILFKLTDGTEIVAKRIELRKAKEARKEFAILISAKKAGLPTAEPVGFLSGKEEADGSYLLMKKLEGHSGRKFEKELTESGKYTTEQIKAIMQQVAQKNKEMAELFRTTLKIDKRWRIKDTIIEFNEETREVESIVPIDWERAQNYNPNTPKEIDEIQ